MIDLDRQIAKSPDRQILMAMLLSLVLSVTAFAAATRPAATQRASGTDQTFAHVPVATLARDAEVAHLLAEADAFLKADQARQAAQVLGAATDSADGALVTRDGRMYRAAVLEVQDRVAALPATALARYRLHVDGRAAALLGDADAWLNERTLSQVIERYPYSSVGPRAMLALARLRMDHGHFDDAVDLLERLLAMPKNVYPTGATGGLPASADRAVVRQALTVARKRMATSGGTHPRRRRAFASDASGGWRVGFDLYGPKLPRASRGGEMWQSAGVGDQDYPRALFFKDWQTHDWVPAAQPVLGHGRIYDVEHGRLVCRDLANGKTLWRSDAPKAHLPGRWAYRGLLMYDAKQVIATVPLAPVQVDALGNRIAQSLLLDRGTIYSIDDAWASLPALVDIALFQDERHYERGLPANSLVARDAITGKVRWRFDGRRLDPEDRFGFRMVSKPAICDGRVLIVAFGHGELRLVALDKVTGHLQWQRTLCTLARTESIRWTPVGVTVVGSRLYIATGEGLVLAANASDGMIRWARRYDRIHIEIHRPPRLPIVGASPLTVFPRGFAQNRILAVDGLLLVMPSDARRVLALVPSTGELRYEIDATGMDTCLGVKAGGLFLAGRRAVRRYDVATGKLTWHKAVSRSYGQGVLEPKAIAIPLAKSVLRLGALDGHVLGQSPMVTPKDEPLGNLFVWRGRLGAIGPDSVRVIESQPRMNAEKRR